MITNKMDPEAIAQYFEPLGQAMLDEIYDDESREVGDIAACKAISAYRAYPRTDKG